MKVPFIANEIGRKTNLNRSEDSYIKYFSFFAICLLVFLINYRYKPLCSLVYKYYASIQRNDGYGLFVVAYAIKKKKGKGKKRKGKRKFNRNFYFVRI